MPDALSGCSIVITRPIDQTHQLAELVQSEGGHPVLFPLLAIAPLEDSSDFHAALETLDTCDWAIFISSNAVQRGMPAVLRRFPQLPSTLRFCAIGPSTKAELEAFGAKHVLTPEIRFDSESLLALPEMQSVQGQRIMIFRGVGGRELMAEALRARGAQVRFAECYRRINPQADANDLIRLWQNSQLEAVVVTSSEALRHLLALAGTGDWLKNTLICVNHPRIGELARQHGLQVAVAETPGDIGMLHCLIQNRRHT